ncbi:MAG: hypothetical protein J5780_02070 [Treponema sp.]|nr:hypothetical protein [Treponema sp.]
MDIVEYKCPNCTADLKFVPSSQKLCCEYCGGSFTIEEVKKLFEKNEAALDKEEAAKNQKEKKTSKEADGSDDFTKETKLYHCSSCGAEIMATDEQTALFCYYCHNPVILSGKMTGKYRPQKIISFKIDRNEAVEKFKKWCFKTFVPRSFKTEQQLEKITGLYVPFWLADCTMNIDYEALGKTIRTWSSKNYDYIQTKEFRVLRKGTLSVEKIPADGSKRIDDELMESIEPFDYSALRDFSMSYLSGFYAEKFDMDKEDMLPHIKERIDKTCQKAVNHSIFGYNSVTPVRQDFSLTRAEMNYAMLPVWFMSYKYKDKVYEFVLNGQTGKIAGTPPVDTGKLRKVTWAIAAAVTLVSYFAGGLILGGIF